MAEAATAESPRGSKPSRTAPVSYADIRPRVQRARLGLGTLLLTTTIVVALLGGTGSWIPPTAAAILILDASIRLRTAGGPFWSFIVDAVTLALVVSANSGVHAPLISLMAYLLVGTILLVPPRETVWVMATAASVYALLAITVFGSVVTPTFDVDATTAAGVWVQFAIFFTATTLVMLEGAFQIRRADLRQVEALAAERRASDMKTQFVSMISHELRTPLTNISGFADTLIEAWRSLQPDEIDEFLAIIRTESEHLGNLVDDVLAIPRLETGRLLVDITDFNLRPLAFRIADLIFPASGEKEASVSVSGSVVLAADPNRVEQVLRNLLDNARKYGGDRVGIESFPRGDSHVVVVADNGHGVPEEARDRIFEQFEQVTRGDSRTETGVGLGLTVTQRLVEAMGGQVWYEPGFPVGARFCFSLPAGGKAETTSPKTTDRVPA